MKNDRSFLTPVFLPVTISQRSETWQPAVDIYQTPAGWLVKVDLAGVRPDDVSVEIVGRIILIRGQRRDLCLEEGCSHYRMEIAYSLFERALELPDDLDRVRVTTEFRNGMLLVRICRMA
jgi:HSP20 family protein